MSVAAAVAPAFPALAEVCDKERPHWSPGDGPVNQLAETVFFFSALLSNAPGLAIVLILALPFVFRKRWIWLLSSGVAALLISMLAADWWEMDAVSQAAMTEGCRTIPILPIALLSALLLWMLWRGLRRAPTATQLSDGPES